MAGGRGERFWPRSTEKCPKQLQKVYSNKTLLEETIARAETVTDRSHIFVGCNDKLKKAILKTHKILKPANFIVEPEGRNTAPIIALAALHFEKKFPGHPHIVLSADHFITPLSEFRHTIKEALTVAEDGWLVTLGVKPNRPDTNYGYIATGTEMEVTGAHKIDSFVEKPDQDRAIEYFKKDNYFWNSGIFIWKGSTILDEFSTHAPAILDPLKSSYHSPSELKKNFMKVPSEPVDIAILEKSKRIAMVRASFTWDDVGSWMSLERIVEGDVGGNVLVPSDVKSHLVARDSFRNILLTKRRLVALLGVSDTVIVEEGDVLFVSSREAIGKIKSMLGELRKNPSLQKYL